MVDFIIIHDTPFFHKSIEILGHESETMWCIIQNSSTVYT